MKTGSLKALGKDWQLIMENGKTIKVPPHYIVPKEMDGAVVQYDNPGGKIDKILHQGSELPRKEVRPARPEPKHLPAPGGHREGGWSGHGSQAQRGRDGRWNKPATYASAPYNFIPLPHKIVPAPEVTVDFSSYRQDLLSGYIDLEIEAKTDIFIRGEREKFFSIAGRPSIPGSSMRGLIRSMVELVSFSKLSYTDWNRRFFYRNINDPDYRAQFLGSRTGNHIKIKSKGGYLVKKGRRFELYPVDKVYRVDMNRLRDPGFSSRIIERNKCHSQVDVWYDPAKVDQFKQKGNLLLEYNTLKELYLSDRGSLLKGVLLRTGPLGDRKHYQWVFPMFTQAREPFDVTKVMDTYASDENRDPSADLVKLSHEGKPVPCFYLTDDEGKPEFIGQTGIFRIPYRKRVVDCMPNPGDAGTDIAQSIFGGIEQGGSAQRSGRVFFEDCLCEAIDPASRFAPLKILSSPKPTSWQLYLEQQNGRQVNWDSEGATIRGQKLYWHRVGMKWENEDPGLIGRSREWLIENALVNRNTQHTVAEVLKAGTSFSGRVRFENLHPAELGALLAALKLPSECAHKIGMGKPYGMGSIRIEPRLFLIDRARRYSSFFIRPVDGENKLSEQKDPAGIEAYLAEFVRHLVAHSGMKADPEMDWYGLLKNNGRLRELYAMLLLHPIPDPQAWISKTDYMDLPKFRHRYVLRKPTDHL